MRIAHTIDEMRTLCKELRSHSAAPLCLVPTMGALHAGHVSLLHAARSQGPVVASIFVNPLQFGPSEDFSKYPRTFDADCDLLAREGVDLLFAPSPEEMTPAGAHTFVDVPDIGSRLDGASRPGHFRGVATIVAKLFHIVQPDKAFFGQKDAAQVAVLRAMVRDLNFDLELVVCPTVREPDGLALSSRNRYLNAAERAQALSLSNSLRSVEQLSANDEYTAESLRAALLSELEAADGVRLDYAAIVEPDTLLPVDNVRNGALVAVAAWVGATRLIDNIVLPPHRKEVAA